MEKFKCTNCGNPITADDIKMVAGAPTVHCPYCSQIYQLTEEPKW
jgi:DNA-directed RNA polymerase subunit RPC12/RpoP